MSMSLNDFLKILNSSDIVDKTGFLSIEIILMA